MGEATHTPKDERKRKRTQAGIGAGGINCVRISEGKTVGAEENAEWEAAPSRCGKKG